MARLARLTLPGHPHLLVLRGNNRQPVFQGAQDYSLFLDLLAEHAPREKLALHSYVLTDEQVTLLVTPQSAQGPSRMIQAVGRQYVASFNRRYGRSGTLWEGRYRSALLQAEAYLLMAMAYLDLAPVRGGLASRPADYRWCSHAHYVGQRGDKRLSPHALYWQLGNTPFAREARYAELVAQGLTQEQEAALSKAALKGWTLGDAQFLASVQAQTTRRVSPGRPGRPRKAAQAVSMPPEPPAQRLTRAVEG